MQRKRPEIVFLPKYKRKKKKAVKKQPKFVRPRDMFGTPYYVGCEFIVPVMTVVSDQKQKYLALECLKVWRISPRTGALVIDTKTNFPRPENYYCIPKCDCRDLDDEN